MFWSAAASREDMPNSDSFDDSEGYNRYRSRSKREVKAARSSSWIPSLFGPASDAHSHTPSRKSRRRDKNRATFLKLHTSRGWGLLLISILFIAYVFIFSRHFRSTRASDAQDRSYEPARRQVLHPVWPVPLHPDRRPPPSSRSGSLRSSVENARPPRHPAAPDRIAATRQTSPVRLQPVLNRARSPTDRLIVAPNTGTLNLDAVKLHYRQLAKHYLRTFTGGIYRQLFFDVLRRRTYALTPPGANKGVQCILFQIINKRVYMMDPYEVPRNSKPFYRTRINEVIWILSRLAEDGRIRDTEFLMAIHDCVQTVNKPHTYRGAHYQESNPTFTIVTCNFSNNIPFPMWEGADRDGGFLGWDAYVRAYAADGTLWSNKRPLAVFRGSNRPSMYFRNKEDADEQCDRVGRTRLVCLQRQNPEFFDVSVGGRCGGKHFELERLSPHEHHRFKYIMYMEGNCGWADRLRHQVFGPSAIIKQETPCQQFFEPLMGPMTHYIPTDFFLTDTVRQIEWARANDDTVQQIVRNANEFARNFLTRQSIEAYVEVLLDEYTKLLVEPDIKLENGAVEVTNKKV